MIAAELPMLIVQAQRIAAAQTSSLIPQCRCTQASSRAGLSSSHQRPLRLQSGWRYLRFICCTYAHAITGPMPPLGSTVCSSIAFQNAELAQQSKLGGTRGSL